MSARCGWGRFGTARVYHFFSGLRSVCGRWTRHADAKLHDNPDGARCERCTFETSAAAVRVHLRRNGRHAELTARPLSDPQNTLRVATNMARFCTARAITVGLEFFRELVRLAGGDIEGSQS